MNEAINRVRELQDLLEQSMQLSADFQMDAKAVNEELSYICGLIRLDIHQANARAWSQGYVCGLDGDAFPKLNPYRSES